jgi:hypothetical protein
MVHPFQGSLFTSDFLIDSITRLPDWRSISDEEIEAFVEKLQVIFSAFPTMQTPNEAQTEDDLIWKVLGALGWGAFLRQQNLAPRGRDDVPDGLPTSVHGTKRTWCDVRVESAFGGKAEIAFRGRQVRV